MRNIAQWWKGEQYQQGKWSQTPADAESQSQASKHQAEIDKQTNVTVRNA